jgi:hypothetical protein
MTRIRRNLTTHETPSIAAARGESDDMRTESLLAGRPPTLRPPAQEDHRAAAVTAVRTPVIGTVGRGHVVAAHAAPTSSGADPVPQAHARDPAVLRTLCRRPIDTPTRLRRHKEAIDDDADDR